MKRSVMAVIAGVSIAVAVPVVTAATAAATPPPPSPACAVFSYPVMLLIEATGGQSSPLLPLANSIQPVFCG